MKYFYELTISSSPHVHSPITTQTIMRDVLIALAPALIGSVYFFGIRALVVTLISAAACVFFEWAYNKLTKTPCKVYDLSAVVTGVLLAFVCPVTIPYWCIIIGDFFAMIVVKAIFGGIGRNIVNPALAARAFMFSWPALMTNWVVPGFGNQAGIFSTADAVTGATPLAQMGQGLMPEAHNAVTEHLFKQYGLDFLLCCHLTDNEQSKRVQEKCGFQHYKLIQSETRYGLVKDTWASVLYR